jgi:hypothetical protein
MNSRLRCEYLSSSGLIVGKVKVKIKMSFNSKPKEIKETILVK